MCIVFSILRHETRFDVNAHMTHKFLRFFFSYRTGVSSYCGACVYYLLRYKMHTHTQTQTLTETSTDKIKYVTKVGCSQPASNNNCRHCDGIKVNVSFSSRRERERERESKFNKVLSNVFFVLVFKLEWNASMNDRHTKNNQQNQTVYRKL